MMMACFIKTRSPQILNILMKLINTDVSSSLYLLYKQYGLHLARKYAQVFVRRYYLFREAK